jgi:Family of unknown function (DUF6152)
MKGRWLAAVFLVVVVLISAKTLSAHHGNAAFDVGKRTTVKGTVTEWLWANPHCWLKFDAKDDKGEIVHWVAESNNSSDMLEKGWSKRTLNVGDNITVTVEPVKNGKPVGRLLEVVLPNGQTLGMAYLKK